MGYHSFACNRPDGYGIWDTMSTPEAWHFNASNVWRLHGARTRCLDCQSLAAAARFSVYVYNEQDMQRFSPSYAALAAADPLLP